jgi:hypothetical protein
MLSMRVSFGDCANLWRIARRIVTLVLSSMYGWSDESIGDDNRDMAKFREWIAPIMTRYYSRNSTFHKV